MERKHAIEVKYLPATNFRPSRFKITSDLFKQSLTFSFNYSASSLYDMAALARYRWRFYIQHLRRNSRRLHNPSK
jgi:hypothetical protein